MGFGFDDARPMSSPDHTDAALQTELTSISMDFSTGRWAGMIWS
jgi:hypothetical protein